MRALILVAAAALSLAACGGNDATENADANLLAMDNMMTDQNLMVDGNMSMDANSMGGMDGNMATNMQAENNMMAADMNTNAPDTNLANGM